MSAWACQGIDVCLMLISKWYTCQGIKAAQRVAVVIAAIDRLMHVHVQQGLNSTT